MAQSSRLAAFAGMAAALSMAATPAAAADLSTVSIAPASPIATPGVFDAEEVNADRHRRYRRFRGYRHRNRIDGGDVLAGVLIIGGIAAIASAASNANREKRYRTRDYRDRDYPYRERSRNYRERRGDSRYDGGRGIDRAVSRCVDHIERDVRIDSVDGVDRTGEGWRVTGSIYNGDRFTCRIGNDGRVDDVDFGGGFSAAPSPINDAQHSDDRYAAAWDKVDRGAPAAASASEPQPAYPGGPIDGDLAADGAADDRYRTAQAPDFSG